MPNTSFGAPISFGWEFENSSLAILDWYRPMKRPDDWEKWGADQKQAYVRNLQASKEWRPKASDGVDWSHFERAPQAPAFLADLLKQEIFGRTWELTPQLDRITSEVDQLFGQLDQVRAKFPVDAETDQAKGFQVHIVFAAPQGTEQDKAYWNARIAALYQLLNDYAAMKSYRKKPKSITTGRFTGAAVESLGRLQERLNTVPGADGMEIEARDEDSDWVGKYKYHFVGLRREAYDEDGSLLGLEIRSGWKNDWGRFRGLIERVVGILGNLEAEAHLKGKRPGTSGSPGEYASFYLESHLDFKAQPLAVEPGLLDQLFEEAKRALKAVDRHTKDGRLVKLPFVYSYDKPSKEEEDEEDDPTDFSKEAKLVVKRWSLAFAPWEHHAALSWDANQCREIVAARDALIRDVKGYLKHNKTASANKRMDRKVLHDLFKTFFSKARLYRYL